MSDSDKVNIPEPLHLIISPELYKAIKNNQGLMPDSDKMERIDAEEFEKFKGLFKNFLDLLNKHQDNAFSILSTIMGMWGYGRKYCGMCGKPIIGKPGHIENRMVCGRCFESFRIADALYQKDSPSEAFAKHEYKKPIHNEISGSPRDSGSPGA
jgi:hypothetical protein